MSSLTRREAILGMGTLASVAGLSAAATGEAAPDFTAPATTGVKVTLSQFRGKKNVVLAFFPKAFTGGCTKEMQGYQAGISQFVDSNTVVFGISLDDVETNKKFADSLGLEFALLSDPSGEVAKKYGVYNAERNIASRTTFVIDKEGKITHTEEGSAAIDISGAAMACSRLK
jgi:peroxiredoxin